MDINFNQEELEFRDYVRNFIKKNLNNELRIKVSKG